MLKEPGKPNKGADPDDVTAPETATLQQLNELATARLSEIVRRGSAREHRWRGYEESEIAAARELLAKESSEIVR